MSLRHRWQAWRELWGRYARAFVWHWQRRDQLQGRMLREDEAQFLPAALAVQETPPSRA